MPAPRAPAARPSLEMLLSEQLSALDGVMNEVTLGIRNQRQYDDIEEAACAVADGIYAAFRKGRR